MSNEYKLVWPGESPNPFDESEKEAYKEYEKRELDFMHGLEEMIAEVKREMEKKKS